MISRESETKSEREIALNTHSERERESEQPESDGRIATVSSAQSGNYMFAAYTN
jgi:hypothetical protein